VQRRGRVLPDIDFNTLHAFDCHLRRCRCLISSEERSAITHVSE
jgi:hypothetical protein